VGTDELTTTDAADGAEDRIEQRSQALRLVEQAGDIAAGRAADELDEQRGHVHEDLHVEGRASPVGSPTLSYAP